MQTISSTHSHSNAMRMLAALMMVVLFFTMLMPSAFAASDIGTTNAKVVLRKSADKDSKAL